MPSGGQANPSAGGFYLNRGGSVHGLGHANRRIFHYLAGIEQPQLLGLRGLDRTAVYEFRSGRLSHLGPDDAPLEVPGATARSDFEALIRNWEALRLEARR